jgi:hypothetical protein
MDAAQVAEVDKAIGSRTEEEFWWDSFRLLIPRMRDIDVNTLRKHFTPYYLPSARDSLTLSPMNVADMMMQPQSLISPGQYGHAAMPMAMMDSYMSMMVPFTAQSLSQETAVADTPRGGRTEGGGEGGARDDFRRGSDAGYGQHQPQQPQQQGQQQTLPSEGNLEDARAHVATIREMTSLALMVHGLPADAHGALRRIFEVLPLLEQSIR